MSSPRTLLPHGLWTFAHPALRTHRPAPPTDMSSQLLRLPPGPFPPCTHPPTCTSPWAGGTRRWVQERHTLRPTLPGNYSATNIAEHCVGA
eukprot:354624-Chlamydomonas_euryale.AAC.3